MIKALVRLVTGLKLGREAARLTGIGKQRLSELRGNLSTEWIIKMISSILSPRTQNSHGSRSLWILKPLLSVVLYLRNGLHGTSTSSRTTNRCPWILSTPKPFVRPQSKRVSGYPTASTNQSRSTPSTQSREPTELRPSRRPWAGPRGWPRASSPVPQPRRAEEEMLPEALHHGKELLVAPSQ